MRSICTMIVTYMLLFIGVCFSGTIRPDVSESKYLDFGKKFFCVKQIYTQKKNETGKTEYGIGTCVVINEHWIITAAHIADRDFDSAYITIDQKKHCINKIIINPDYDTDKLTGDICLGFCEKGFGEVSEPTFRKKNIEIGEICSIAGYGQYGNMKTGAKIYDGKIRAGTNKIEFKYNDMVVCDASSDNTKTVLEFLPNVGDSGGGLFINGELAGIMSLVFSKDKVADSNYGDEAAFVELSPYLPWINKYVKTK